MTQSSHRILLVSPVFHGYWRAVSAALSSRGHRVVVHNYDAPGTLRGRVENKLQWEFGGNRIGRWAGAKLTERVVACIRSTKPTAVLVIKGDQLGEAFWHELEAQKIPTVLWLYDELDRMSYAPEAIAGRAPIVSYSRGDVATLRNAGANATYLPDAFDSLSPVRRINVDAVTFVGARYPKRERLVRGLHDAGVPVRAYGREWSRRPIDVVRSRRFAPAGVPWGPDLARPDYYGVMAGSKATLNIHGDAHEGFSMRTFEAPGVGGLQLIDRPDVGELYEPGEELLVFESLEELIDLSKRARRERAWARRVAQAGQRRTLAEHTFIHRMQTVEALWA